MIFLDLPIAYIILACCVVVPIFVLLIVAFIIAIVKRIKLAKKYKPNKKTGINDETKTLLLEAFGENNIESVSVEMSRLTVEVKDVDLVNPDKIKEAGANGVLLVGNKVKCSFGDKAIEVCNLLK
ncbi:MAG: hypothetical protein SOU07_00575 [Bacilli bacterium]|nr:PTS transporter subunit EIIB [Acholeplasmataceae bacterium]MDY2901923.1 hypothetical protein [Bacilli bacterium]